MIEVNEKIEVAADPQRVWNFLSDPRSVVECVEGAALGEQQEDGTYDASITVKFGPAKVAFRAKLELSVTFIMIRGDSLLWMVTSFFLTLTVCMENDHQSAIKSCCQNFLENHVGERTQ